METLNSIECFVRTAQAGSFAEAGRRLGLTAAAVGKNVARLEQGVGVRLFHRTTRSLTLTEAGQRFLDEVGGSLSTIQSAVANLAGAAGQPAGTLRVSMGHTFGLTYIVPLLEAFLERYPRITPDWHFDNRSVDLVAEKFDAAIGGGFELSPGVIARELAPAHRMLVASSSYLARHAPITAPEQLAGHDGIYVRSPQTGRVAMPPLQDGCGAQRPLLLGQRMSMSDPEAACRVAAMGLGIALVSVPHALPHLEQGGLQRVLPGWYADAGMLSIYFPAQKLLPSNTRVFVDFIVEHFRRERLAQCFDARKQTKSR
jgi:DNA-binding transcriptional LysR family regulator